MPSYSEQALILHNSVDRFMTRCRQEACAVALGDLSLASGLMPRGYLQVGRFGTFRAVSPRLLVVTGEERVWDDAYVLATYGDDSRRAPLITMAWTSPAEAYKIPPRGRPHQPLSEADFIWLGYDLGLASPVQLPTDDAEYFLNRMLRYCWS